MTITIQLNVIQKGKLWISKSRRKHHYKLISFNGPSLCTRLGRNVLKHLQHLRSNYSIVFFPMFIVWKCDRTTCNWNKSIYTVITISWLSLHIHFGPEKLEYWTFSSRWHQKLYHLCEVSHARLPVLLHRQNAMSEKRLHCFDSEIKWKIQFIKPI